MNAKSQAIVRMGKIPTATDAGLGTKFAKMVARRQFIKDQMKRFEAELGDRQKGIYGLNDEIEEVMTIADVKVVTCGDETVTVCDGTNVSLKKERLTQNMLEAGIEADIVTEVIEASTDIKKYTYVQVTRTKVLAERAEKLGFEVKSGPVKKARKRGKS